MSGRVAASSLYTVQAEDMILLPPEAAQAFVRRHRTSQTVSVWKGFRSQHLHPVSSNSESGCLLTFSMDLFSAASFSLALRTCTFTV